MKQKFTSLFAIGIMALTLNTTNVFATDHTNVKTISIAEKRVEKAKKLNVSGNVHVTIVQDAESKRLFSLDNGGKAKVYEEDGVIYVSSKTNALPVAVTVYVNNIDRITGDGKAVVKTKNILKVQYLQIILSDNSTANINAETESLYTMLSNETAITLSGSTAAHFISANELAVIDTKNLTATKVEIEKRNLGYTTSK